MTLKQEIYARLTANGTITNIVNAVYSLTPEQGALQPFLYYTVSDPAGELTLTGSTGIYTYSVMVEGWTANETDQQTLYDAVLQSMHGWSDGTVLLSKLSGGAMENMEGESGEETFMFQQEYKVIVRG